MKKLIFLSLIAITSFTLSACTVKDQLKTKILDKIETKVVEEKTEEPSSEQLTDEQLLNQLNASDSSTDADLKTLETDLQQ